MDPKLWVSRYFDCDAEPDLDGYERQFGMFDRVSSTRKVAPEISVTLTPVPERRFYHNTTGASLSQVPAILQEFLGIIYYWWKGRI